MPIKKSHHRISLVLSKKLYEDFEKVNPKCLSRFLRNCIEYAVLDNEFFQSVYFHDLDNSLVNYCVEKMNNRLDGVLN